MKGKEKKQAKQVGLFCIFHYYLLRLLHLALGSSAWAFFFGIVGTKWDWSRILSIITFFYHHWGTGWEADFPGLFPTVHREFSNGPPGRRQGWLGDLDLEMTWPS